MADAAQAPETKSEPADAGRFASVTLSEPITRGETTITTITLRKPRAGELRGLNLQELINVDIAAILKVVPRISEPVLTSHECDQLDPADLAEMGGTIRGFFMTSAERELMQAMIAEQRRKI